MSKDYVVRLRYAKCSMGTIPNRLNCDQDHGIVYGEDKQPVLNANDHVSKNHIIHFGSCTSSMNPGNASIQQILSNPLKFFCNKLKSMLGKSCCECVPVTLLPWINVKDDHVIEGAPVLTSKSTLCCFYGGIITIEPLPDEGPPSVDGGQG